MTRQAIPKYYRIGQDILARIRSGKLQPGMKAPSENQLIAGYGISNTTARKVLQQIEQDGWVTRVKGKGTFVSGSRVHRSATKVLSFTRNMIEAGHVPSSRVLDAHVVRQGYSATINGRCYTMPGPVYKLHRLRLADGVPMVLEVRYISVKLCPGIVRRDFTGSLYDIYEKAYGHRISEINQMLSVAAIDASACRLFDLPETVPAIKVESVSFCGKEMILEMEDSLYRGDQYRFAIRATP